MKYALPTILSSIFMNVYSLVDSLFVANLVSIDALSAVNIVGPALATGIGYCVQSVIGVIYFAVNRKGSLYFVRPKCNGRALLKACSNGMIEMVSMLAVSITMIAMNVILMHIAGVNGVVAAAVVLSAQNLLSAVYMGYLEGIASVISYNYGAGSVQKLKQIYRSALKTIAVLSGITFVISFLAAEPLARIYAEGNVNVKVMAIQGIHVFAAAFLLMGFNMFASSMFTAFNDGKTSALLSLLRTLVFLIIPLMILPGILGVNGVWLSMPAAELLAMWCLFTSLKRKSRCIIMLENRENIMEEQNRRCSEMMQKIDRLYENYAKAKGMTYMSMAVLESICSHKENCTQKMICEETHYPKQSVNLIVKSFWKEGYITLEELPEDRRNKRILLTEKGRGMRHRRLMNCSI